MIEALVSQIVDQINSARHHEQTVGELRARLQDNIGAMHAAIDIKSSSPIDALIQFVESYVSSIPEHINGFNSLAKEADIEEYIQPFLNLACAYFLKPPTIIATEDTLRNTLEKAYLTHRLLEEVNDQVLTLSGAPLAPLDMSMANIISHSIVGDDQANALDHLVLLSIETENINGDIFEKRSVRKYMQKRKLDGWSDVLQNWPCFTKDMAVLLQIG